MKKILSALVLIGFLSISLVSVVSAQEIPKKCTIKRDTGIADCPSTGDTEYDKCYKNGSLTNCPEGVGGAVCCFVHAIITLTDWIFVVLISIAVLLVLYGAFLILAAGGNAERVGEGRKLIIFAAVGLAVAFLAKAIPAVVRAIIS
ncbi:MAG: hypothetical protein QME61_01555 [Patescibacteria group bacterium]|nr:hypothetical protein [Patescibacteria group bacterium]